MMRQRFLLASVLCLAAALSKSQDELPANPITPGIDLDMPTILVGDANNDGKVNTANSYYQGAFKTAWRVVTCTPAPDNEFNGK